MTSSDFDPVEYKAGQRAAWNAASPGWATWQEEFERGAASVTARLLELGGVRPGQRVLDVATGHGEPALSAARVVGPVGRVVATDIAPAMLEVARQRAAGVDNVDFIEADMESLGEPAASFDVVLSRFGLMLAADHIGTFRSLARLLAPAGVLAAAVWGPPARHLLSIGPTVLSERLGMPSPPPGVPGPFGMSDPAQLTDELAVAGFADVSVTEHVVPFRFPSVEAYVRFNREVLPPQILRTVRERFGSEDDPDTWAAIARAAEKYVDDDGSLPLPSVALCLRAVKARADA
jgi:SAM-dependent methyltransferase